MIFLPVKFSSWPPTDKQNNPDTQWVTAAWQHTASSLPEKSLFAKFFEVLHVRGVYTALFLSPAVTGEKDSVWWIELRQHSGEVRIIFLCLHAI